MVKEVGSPRLFKNLDLTPIHPILWKGLHQGGPGKPVIYDPMWDLRALMLRQLLQIPYVKDLVKRLRREPYLRRACVYGDRAPCEAQIDEGDFSGTVPSNFYGEYVYQGAYVFSISRDGIELRGRVTHVSDESFLKSGLYFDSEYSVERSLYIEDGLYTISRGMLKINDLGTLEELAALELGEGVG